MSNTKFTPDPQLLDQLKNDGGTCDLMHISILAKAQADHGATFDEILLDIHSNFFDENKLLQNYQYSLVYKHIGWLEQSHLIYSSDSSKPRELSTFKLTESGELYIKVHSFVSMLKFWADQGKNPRLNT